MKILLLITVTFALAGCVVAPLEPAPAVYASTPSVVVEGHYYPRRHRLHRHRHWR
jgi:hypothetical protein